LPKATVSLLAEHFDLKTCPEGFVKLKRFSYGAKLRRQQMAMAASMRAQDDGQGNVTEAEMAVAFAQRKVAEFEFSECIVDHNLDGDDQNKLNFQNPQTVDVLDPRIGEEISTLIANMNNYMEAETDQRGNSTTGSSASSQGTSTQPETPRSDSSSSSTTSV
jgi:hypothetical protein